MSDDDLIDLTGTRTREGPRAIELPQRYPPLPKQWSEIEHLESKMAVEIFKRSGPLAVLLNQRISELKFITAPRGLTPESFIVPVLVFLQGQFQKSLTERTPDGLIAARKTQKIIEMAPDVKELSVGIQSMQENEHIVYKLVIDLLRAYFLYFEGSPKPMYMNTVLPLVQRFHATLSDAETDRMNLDLTKVQEQLKK